MIICGVSCAILNSRSKIVAMEIQISALKEDLETEHQRWRAAQANYERQVTYSSNKFSFIYDSCFDLIHLTNTTSSFEFIMDIQFQGLLILGANANLVLKLFFGTM